MLYPDLLYFKIDSSQECRLGQTLLLLKLSLTVFRVFLGWSSFYDKGKQTPDLLIGSKLQKNWRLLNITLNWNMFSQPQPQPCWYLGVDSFVGRGEYPVSFLVVSNIPQWPPFSPCLSTAYLAWWPRKVSYEGHSCSHGVNTILKFY